MRTMLLQTIFFLTMTSVVSLGFALGIVPDDSYLQAVFTDNKQVFRYDLDLQGVHAKLISSCEIPFTDESCKLPVMWESSLDRYKRKVQDADLLRAQLKSIPYFYALDATLDPSHSLALITNRSDSQTKYRFRIFQLLTSAEIVSGVSERRAIDAEWIGNHGCFALLTRTTSSAVALLPWNWLQTFSGHPPQYDTYYLELYTLDGHLLGETVIHEKIRNSNGYFVTRRSFTLENIDIYPQGPC